MSVVPDDIDAERGPPMSTPLRHFVVGLGFLLAGLAVGGLVAAGVAPGLAVLAHVHLLLVGWVCVTIMGAMTQFVPVWSGAPLHSRRLASAELWLVGAGVAGLAVALLAGRVAWLPVAGSLLFAGIWTFGYNLARTLARVDSPGVTERHFALGVGFFALVSVLGILLALDFAVPVLPVAGVTHARLLAAHATLAVFGVILTTVFGALYQLGTMFTQTELHGVDVHLRRVEEVGYPVGVLLLAGGRLVGSPPVARVGGVLVVLGALSLGVVLGRKLLETRVPRTPMLSRYAVVAGALLLWAVLAARTWVADPLARSAWFGPAGVAHLLLVGVVAFVVAGTLYHVVPFIVWVNRYSDLLGYEKVPMIDDLYVDRVAAVDFWALLGGGAFVALHEAGAPGPLAVVGGALALAGGVLFAANLLGVLWRHSPQPLSRVVLGRLVGPADAASQGEK